MENEKTELVELSLTLTARDLWEYARIHANEGFRGFFNLFFTVAFLGLLLTQWGAVSPLYRLLLGMAVLLFPVWQPVLLYQKAVRQAKTGICSPMILRFSQEGMWVEQNGEEGSVLWEQFVYVERRRTMIILHMDRIHAYLLPNRVLEGKEESLRKLICAHVPARQRKRI